jgi:hypothetical protein
MAKAIPKMTLLREPSTDCIGVCGIVGVISLFNLWSEIVSRGFCTYAFSLNAIETSRVGTKEAGDAPSYETISVYAFEIYEILLMSYVQLNHRLRLYWKVRHGYLSLISFISTNTLSLQALTPQDTHFLPLNGTYQLPPSNSPH